MGRVVSFSDCRREICLCGRIVEATYCRQTIAVPVAIGPVVSGGCTPGHPPRQMWTDRQEVLGCGMGHQFSICDCLWLCLCGGSDDQNHAQNMNLTVIRTDV